MGKGKKRKNEGKREKKSIRGRIMTKSDTYKLLVTQIWFGYLDLKFHNLSPFCIFSINFADF